MLRNFASRLTKLALSSSMGAASAAQVSCISRFSDALARCVFQVPSPSVSIDVLLTWATANFAAVKVRHEPRRRGESNYTVSKLIAHAFNLMTGSALDLCELQALSASSSRCSASAFWPGCWDVILFTVRAFRASHSSHRSLRSSPAPRCSHWVSSANTFPECMGARWNDPHTSFSRRANQPLSGDRDADPPTLPFPGAIPVELRLSDGVDPHPSAEPGLLPGALGHRDSGRPVAQIADVEVTSPIQAARDYRLFWIGAPDRRSHCVHVDYRQTAFRIRCSWRSKGFASSNSTTASPFPTARVVIFRRRRAHLTS